MINFGKISKIIDNILPLEYNKENTRCKRTEVNKYEKLQRNGCTLERYRTYHKRILQGG